VARGLQLKAVVRNKPKAVSPIFSAMAAYTDTPLSTEQPSGQSASAANGVSMPSAIELEQTLQRLVRRVAMMLQAEKCAFLLHEPDSNQLVARPPSLGLSPDQIRQLRLAPDDGLCSEAYESGQALAVETPQQFAALSESDREWMTRIGVRNLIVQPLVMERRDEQERVIAHVTVGVLLIINKRGGDSFSGEDLLLLGTMARQVTAAITNAQMYLRLAEEKEQLQATLQSLLAGVVMLEPSGHISLMNPAAGTIFGIGESALRKHYTEAITNKDVREMLDEAFLQRRESHREIEVLLPGSEKTGDEPRIFQAQTAFVRASNAGASVLMGVAVVFNDVTAIRNVERMKTAFVSTVSHELRTPLTSIKGFIATLLQDTEGYFGPEERQEFYEIIDSECDRLRRLIEDLLNVSRIEAGRALDMNWSQFDPIAISKKSLQVQRSYASERHQLRLKTHGILPPVTGDADKFDQIITNLVSNAIKYSPYGGEVIVDLDSDGTNLTVKVSDQGIGIPPDKLGKVFEKFERVDNRDTREVGGTGIGLFLVKHLVERHNGTIWAESEVGKGSTFTFTIPLTRSEPTEE
jgi:PAS domain S-box-containing protein